ncbi:MAG: tetratricopeptide repeat protein [Candidatus Marinimicrobia bacterium]|nr:tetratricopeptide repeat protein [Candidatus Neomarinimicrobiota bacterium]
MSEVPEIFQNKKQNIETVDPHEFMNTSRWAEFVAHLTQFSEGDIPQTEDQLSAMLSSEANPAVRSILYAGTARCQIHAGNFIGGAQTLGYAYSLTDASDKESRAFVLLEMCAFMAITAQYDLAIMLLDKIPQLTQSKYLLSLANYYWLVLKTRKGDLKLVDRLVDSAVYFKEIGEMATVAYHYKNIGNVHRKLKAFPLAEQYYTDALLLAEHHSYQHIQAAVLHDKGMLSFYQGNPEKGISILNDAFEIAENHYTKSFTLGNIGFIYRSISQYDHAIDYLKRSIEIAVNHGVYSVIPSIAYHLGNCYETQEETSLAMYFYQKAYESAVELLNQRFPFTGDRERAIKTYVRFIAKHPECTPSTADDIRLSFSIDKTLKEIRGIFQNTALETLLNEYGSVNNTVSQIDIPKRTYYAIRERTRENSFHDAPSYVTEFVKNNAKLNWKELNRKFEDHVITFLYQKYGGSKKMLSEKLNVSYHHMVTMISNTGSNQLTD